MKVFCFVIFFSIVLPVSSQDSLLHKYGPRVIDNPGSYKKSIEQKPGFSMQDVKRLVPGVVLELRYAGRNNFTRQQLYPSTNRTYLRSRAATALAAVQRELNLKGLGLKIFDAYRPYAVTEKMWELVKDERYTADPQKGSGHNRGIAVDLTIIDLRTNNELNMGTGFDNFSDTAHHGFTALPTAVLQNRLLLKTIMKKHGFEALETEWWHYALPDAKEYELLNLSFEQLKNLSKKK